MLTLTARITGVGEDHPVSPFFASHFYFFSIDDDHMVATIHVGGIAWLMLAADDLSNLAGDAAQYLFIGINDHPTFIGCGVVCISGFITVMIHFIRNSISTPLLLKRDTKVIFLYGKCKKVLENAGKCFKPINYIVQPCADEGDQDPSAIQVQLPYKGLKIFGIRCNDQLPVTGQVIKLEGIRM